jgi:hypothetical protein
MSKTKASTMKAQPKIQTQKLTTHRRAGIGAQKKY